MPQITPACRIWRCLLTLRAFARATLTLVARPALALCLGAPIATAQEMTQSFGPDIPRPLVVRSTTDLKIFAPVLETFLRTHPDITIRYEQWGSNALHERTLNECQSLEDVASPLRPDERADIVISSAVHQMVELVNLSCATPYRSAQTEALPDALRWRDEVWGITREAAVIIYNRALVPQSDIPATRFALLDLMRPIGTPYEGRVATYDIEASGLGYLFAFKDSQEASTFGALLESFDRSGAIATCCSAEIIDGVGEGRYLLAYNVLGSYALAAQDPRVGIILPQDYTLVLSRAFIMPRHTNSLAGDAPDAEDPARAQTQRWATQLLDFLLSAQGRDALTSVHLMSPVLSDQGAAEFSVSPSTLRPIELLPTLLVARDSLTRGQFIARWRDTFTQDPSERRRDRN
ncbi:ABC transporter substrate-binding protein [Albirhodobacter sp. R86504]|uniref:ABC transporter substrate-binding protein n=1 Tax=Albirhodobacter sp. R86504 TaxID=3093848 RepID=UPI003672A6CB